MRQVLPGQHILSLPQTTDFVIGFEAEDTKSELLRIIVLVSKAGLSSVFKLADQSLGNLAPGIAWFQIVEIVLLFQVQLDKPAEALIKIT